METIVFAIFNSKKLLQQTQEELSDLKRKYLDNENLINEEKAKNQLLEEE